jgi:ubiquinone biosynthesis protein COQ4
MLSGRLAFFCRPSLSSRWPHVAWSASGRAEYATDAGRGARLSPLETLLATVLASYGALRDPRRADLVSLLGETTGDRALRALLARMQASPSGREVLRDKPLVTDDIVRSLADHPPETFGGAYYAFMKARGFRADERPPVRTIEDPDVAYVATRVRQVHDFWHVLFGCHTDVVGEAGLKVVEFMQTGMPMTGMAVVAAELRLEKARRRRLNETYLGWGVRAGSASADLVTLYYEKEFGRGLDDLRAAWRIEPWKERPVSDS